MRSYVFASLVAVALAGACTSNKTVQCKSAGDCTQFAGGTCDVNPSTGNQWCSYPDPLCDSGRRWGSIDEGDGLSGLCQDRGADAGVDAPIVDARGPDAQPDAQMFDAKPGGPIVTDDQPAELVLGQSDFNGGSANAGGSTSAKSVSYPIGVVSDGTGLWVTDNANHRVLRWQPLPVSSYENASLVLGHATLTDGTNPCGTSSAGTTCVPAQVSIGGGKLVVSEGNRVLIWSTLPTTNGQSADHVLCQTTFSAITGGNGASNCSAPSGVWTDGTRLAVADKANNRVLIWTTFPTANGVAANIVLGQSAFGQSGSPGTPSASNMYWPQGVYFDGTHFYVADTLQNRVLVWNGFPTTNNQAADFVLGQSSFTTSTAATTSTGLSNPYSIAVVGTSLFIGDSANDRVMVWTPIPTTSGAAAQHLLGAATFTTAGGSPPASQTSIDQPGGMFIVGDKLYVVDTNHNRVLRFGLNLP